MSAHASSQKVMLKGAWHSGLWHTKTILYNPDRCAEILDATLRWFAGKLRQTHICQRSACEMRRGCARLSEFQQDRALRSTVPSEPAETPGNKVSKSCSPDREDSLRGFSSEMPKMKEERGTSKKGRRGG